MDINPLKTTDITAMFAAGYERITEADVTQQEIREKLQSGKGAGWILVENKFQLGFVWVNAFTPEVLFLSVISGVKNKEPVISVLLEHAITWLNQQGFQKLFIKVETTRDNLRQFYLERGWQVIGETVKGVLLFSK